MIYFFFIHQVLNLDSYDNSLKVIGINDRINNQYVKYLDDEFPECRADSMSSFSSTSFPTNYDFIFETLNGQICDNKNNYLRKHEKEFCKCENVNSTFIIGRVVNGTEVSNLNMPYLVSFFHKSEKMYDIKLYEQVLRITYRHSCTGNFKLYFTFIILTISGVNHFRQSFKQKVCKYCLMNYRQLFNNFLKFFIFNES